VSARGEFAGQIALITGSATGLGAAIAERLAQRGAAALILNYSKSAAEAQETAERCRKAGAEVVVQQGDVASDADCKQLASAAERFGKLDVLVNNAGTTKHVRHPDLDGLSSDDFHRIYGVNVVGAFQMTRAARGLLERGAEASGRASPVVMVSSIAGVDGTGSSIAYAASKAAMNTMTLSLARALAPKIRVNAVCPGFIDTRWFVQGVGEENTAKIRSAVAGRVPLRTASSAGDIADSVVFLCGADSRHVTGETLLVDAGLHLLNG
jgi:NAD(P)-dependent dehydrogenase (short-subunit alcohol dehydrogenase family)